MIYTHYNQYRLIPRYQAGSVVKAVTKQAAKKAAKAAKRQVAKKAVLESREFLENLKKDKNFSNLYKRLMRDNAGGKNQKHIDYMRKTGKYPKGMEPKNLPVTTNKNTQVSNATKSAKPAVKSAVEQEAKQTGKTVGKQTAQQEAKNVGRQAVPRNKALVPKRSSAVATTAKQASTSVPTTQAIITQLEKTNPGLFKRLVQKYGWVAATGMMLFAAGVHKGSSNEELGLEENPAIQDFGVGDEPQMIDVPQLSSEFTPQPSKTDEEILQTEVRKILENQSGASNNAVNAVSGTPVAQAPQAAPAQPAPQAVGYPTGYLVDRKGIRRNLDLYGDGAYGSNVYELVTGLNTVSDTAPFKQALMSRLGMDHWDSNVAYNRLGELGVSGYIGGRDRRRLRNLINSGTNINGEINGFRSGGRIRLLPRQ